MFSNSQTLDFSPFWWNLDIWQDDLSFKQLSLSVLSTIESFLKRKNLIKDAKGPWINRFLDAYLVKRRFKKYCAGLRRYINTVDEHSDPGLFLEQLDLLEDLCNETGVDLVYIGEDESGVSAACKTDYSELKLDRVDEFSSELSGT